MPIYLFLAKNGIDMIVNDYKFIYIHIPNTGGTSIGNIIHPNLSMKHNNKTYGQVLEYKKEHHAEHISYDDYNIETNNRINEYFVFTFVRNPYSKNFSQWRQGCKEYQSFNNNYLRWGIKDNIDKYFCDPNSKILFHKFIDWKYETRNEINLFQRSQLHFIGDIKNINFIGKFEDYTKDLTKVLSLLNNHIRKEIFVYKNLHLNKKSKKLDEYKEYYSSVSKRVVQRLSLMDFLMLDYDYNQL